MYSESSSRRSASSFETSIPVHQASVAIQSATHGASLPGIVSQCPRVHHAMHMVRKVAPTKSTVLILGESGTGKELIARALHQLSGRSGRLVPVNCGAIPEDILESELFGHEKGSFTGAVSSRIGRFQLADGGTIFLDEIGEMSPKLQVKLLRVLQERKIDPVGSSRSVDVDVRVIAATNKNLFEEVKAGRFREDLFYRLQVVPIELPSLRDRGTDSVILANHFLRKMCETQGVETKTFSGDALARIAAHRWPGNVRELENLVERLAVLSDGPEITSSDLPGYLGVDRASSPSAAPVIDIPLNGIDFNRLVDDFETQLISIAMNRTAGNKKAAAKLLGLNRTTLVEKIKKKGLEQREEPSDDGAERPEFGFEALEAV